MATSILQVACLVAASATVSAGTMCGFGRSSSCRGRPIERLRRQVALPAEFPLQDVTGLGLGDVDGDGFVDMVVGYSSRSRSEAGLIFFAGRSNGTFEAVANTGQDPVRGLSWPFLPAIFPTLADIDKDGRLDLVVGVPSGDSNASSAVHIFHREASGSFKKANGFELEKRYTSAVGPAVGDLDRDGHMDLVLGLDFEGLHFFKGQPGGSFALQRGPSTDPFANMIALPPAGLGDLDGDGYLDLVADTLVGLRFYKGLPDGHFKHMDTEGKDPFWDGHAGVVKANLKGPPCIFDLNGDGLMDVVIIEPTGMYALEGQLTSDYKQVKLPEGNQFQDLALSGVAHVAVGDLNNDSLPDFVVGDNSAGVQIFYATGYTDWVASGGQVFTLPHGEDTWATRRPHPYPQIGDLDGDGLVDILVGTPTGVHFLKAQPDGSFSETQGSGNPFQALAPGSRPNWNFAVGDVDEDGIADVVIGTADGVTSSSSLRLLRGLSGAGFEMMEEVASPFHNLEFGYAKPSLLDPQQQFILSKEQREAPVPILADVDMDSHLDIVVVYPFDPHVYFSRGLGRGVFEPGRMKILFKFERAAAQLPVFLDTDRNGQAEGVVLSSVLGQLLFVPGGLCYDDCGGPRRGMCELLSGTCRCAIGKASPETLCSECAAGFFGRRCQPCPGDLRDACSSRGTCDDQVAARKQEWLSMGSGTCTCTSSYFSGADCSQGECPPGMEEISTGREGLNLCQPCHSGYYKDSSTGVCMECPHGFYAESTTRCMACGHGFSSNADRTDCVLDWVFVGARVGSSLALLALLLILPSVICHSIPISDVALERRNDMEGGQRRVVIHTVGLHWVKRSRKDGQTCLPAFFTGTGHPRLDSHGSTLLGRSGSSMGSGSPSSGSSSSSDSSPPVGSKAERHQLVRRLLNLSRSSCSGESPWRVKAFGKRRLQLLSATCAAIDEELDASQGSLHVCFPHTLLGVQFAHIPLGPLVVAICMLLVGLQAMRPLPLPLLLVEVASACIVASACHFIQRRRLRQTPMAYCLQKHKGFLARRHPKPCRCDRGPDRAIEIGRLLDMCQHFQGFLRSRNMYYVNANIVLPLTGDEQLSYAELAGPQQVLWFVSHFWGSPFPDFVQTLVHHAQSVSKSTGTEDERWRQLTYWVCTLSNNQWELEEEIGGGWEMSSFFLALRSRTCQGTIMVLDDRVLPLGRAWCLFELLQTAQRQSDDADFTGLSLCTASGVLQRGTAGVDVAVSIAERLATLRLQDAEASVQADKEMIMELVEQMPGGIVAMNSFMRKRICECLHTTSVGFSAKLGTLLATLGTETSIE